MPLETFVVHQQNQQNGMIKSIIRDFKTFRSKDATHDTKPIRDDKIFLEGSLETSILQGMSLFDHRCT